MPYASFKVMLCLLTIPYETLCKAPSPDPSSNLRNFRGGGTGIPFCASVESLSGLQAEGEAKTLAPPLPQRGRGGWGVRAGSGTNQEIRPPSPVLGGMGQGWARRLGGRE